MTILCLILMFFALWIIIAKDSNLKKIMGKSFVIILLLTIVLHIKLSVMLSISLIYLIIAWFVYKEPDKNYPFIKYKRKWKKKWLMHPLEYIGLSVFSFIFRLMPLEIASWTMGKLAEIFGPMTRGEKTIKMNLDYVMPENNTAKFRRKIWNNWGRSFVEGLFIDYYAQNESKYITIKNIDLLANIQEKPAFLTGLMHYGTMGLMSIPFSKFPFITGIVYRFPNNPLTDEATRLDFGGHVAKTEFIPKGQARMILNRLKQGGNVAISPDLRISEGEELKFFGKSALTSTGIVKMAILFKTPIILCYVHRTHGVHHELIFSEIIDVVPAKTREESEKKTMQLLNDKMEEIIKLDPAQWFWMHTRWGKKL